MRLAHGDGALNPTNRDDNYGYIVIGEAYDGNGAMPYPIAPETWGPDERLSVTGLDLANDHDWSVKLALMTPMGNWDQWAGRDISGESDRRWPLFTLYRDPQNWIEFSADCEGRGFRVRVKSDGGAVSTTDFGEGKQVWLPESPLLVAISFNSTGDELTFGASLGGGRVQMDDEAVISWAGDPLTEIKFRGAIGGFSEDGEVCEMRIIGGEINTSGMVTNTPAAFADLGFLVP